MCMYMNPSLVMVSVKRINMHNLQTHISIFMRTGAILISIKNIHFAFTAHMVNV